jgi:hypothetical protein
MLRSQGNTNRANTLIREDRQITVSEVADMLDVSSGSACVTVVTISLCLWLVQELPLLLELSMYNLQHEYVKCSVLLFYMNIICFEIFDFRLPLRC